MIHCPSCGAANREGSKFCNECGYTLNIGENTRCPMCSADNPVGTVFCRECGARLVPISAPLPEQPEEAPPAPIKGLSLPSKPPSQKEAAAEGEESEEGKEKALRWLRRLGRMQGNETMAEAPTAWPPQEEVPDWLQALRVKYPEEVPLEDRPPPPPKPAADTGPEAPEEADWLQKLRVGTLEETEEEPPPVSAPPPEQPEEEELDWLERLRTGTAGEAEAEEAIPFESPAAAVPDWLSELQIGLTEESPAVAEEAEPEKEAVPDWLSQISPAEEAPPLEAIEAEEAGETEVPDWLKDLQPAAEEGEEVAPIRAEEPPPIEAGEAEVPDWLKELQTAAGEEGEGEEVAPIRAEEPPPLAEPEETAIPEWLDGVQPPIAEEAPTAPEAETPDWLQGLGPVSEAAEVAPEPQPEEVPDWLKDLRPATAEPAPTVEEPEAVSAIKPAAEDEGVPEWLKALGETEPGADEEPPAVQLLPEEEPAREAEMPAWLREFHTPEKEPPITLETIEAEVTEEAIEAAVPEEAPAPLLTEEPLPIEPETEVPDWLKDLRPAAEEEEAAAPVLPEEALPSVETRAEKAAVLLGEEELALAEIPDWLQAMRPAERAAEAALPAQATVPEVIETSGPLAGIRGVLPIEPLIGEPRSTQPVAPPPSKIGPQQASVFEAVIAGLPPAPLEKRKRRRKGLLSRLLRLSIHAFLLLAVLIPILLGTQWFTAASVSGGSEGSRAFFDTVQSLPPDSTVLMAYDYDPATAAEMDLQAEAIVHHLMSRNLKIIAVSLLPAGPAVAQDIMDRAAAIQGYAYGKQYLNLGYLPGHEAGVRDLAQNPVGATKEDYLNREPLTAIPLTQNISRVEDLALIVEMAGSQDSLKWWIEQAGSQHEVPIVAGISAAVEPYARPYYGSGQLAGLISGLIGAAEYEALTDRPASAIDSLDPQATAHLALLVLIVAGNVVYLLTRSKERS